MLAAHFADAIKPANTETASKPHPAGLADINRGLAEPSATIIGEANAVDSEATEHDESRPPVRMPGWSIGDSNP